MTDLQKLSVQARLVQHTHDWNGYDDELRFDLLSIWGEALKLVFLKKPWTEADLPSAPITHQPPNPFKRIERKSETAAPRAAVAPNQRADALRKAVMGKTWGMDRQKSLF